MNIRYMHDILSRIEEIKVIGKNATVNGVICNVMGIVRHGMEMHLLILLYDENYASMAESEEELFDAPGRPETNRMIMRVDRKIDAINPFHSVSKVFIGEREFEVSSLAHGRLSKDDWEHVLLIAKFLDNGWQPNGIDYQNINMLFLASLKLEGDYTSIPPIKSDPDLRFVMREHCVSHQVEKPVTLVIGDKYPDKLIFHDAETGEEHWMQINRVYLSDMWEEMDKVLDDPKLKEQMSPEQITKARSDFENMFSSFCPRGMYLPVVEYECEEDITLQFYSKAYLDAKPSNNGGCFGFIVRPEKSRGILGYKLKASVLQEPVQANTNTIEAELFQYNRIITGDDILLN